MARKRMFDTEIITQDSFLDLPLEAKALYFLLGMEADDEGFVSPKKVLRLYGGTEDSIKLLAVKNYVIPFQSGVIVITDWNINNYLDKSRVKETIYLDEKSQLYVDDKTKKYKFLEASNTKCLTNVKQMLKENRIEENSIEENRVDKKSNNKPEKHKYGEYKNVLLTDKELQSLKSDYDNSDELITYLDEYIEMKGYKAKSHYLCIRKWVVKAVSEKKQSTNKNQSSGNMFFDLLREEGKL